MRSIMRDAMGPAATPRAIRGEGAQCRTDERAQPDPVSVARRHRRPHACAMPGPSHVRPEGPPCMADSVMKEPVLNTSPSPGDEAKTTTCYMCACRCGIKVWLADGRIRYIQGNPSHPVNKGVLCAKGAAGIMQHYSPARLNKPLLRVGERGSGEFKEIEWDEALQLATDWL